MTIALGKGPYQSFWKENLREPRFGPSSGHFAAAAAFFGAARHGSAGHSTAILVPRRTLSRRCDNRNRLLGGAGTGEGNLKSRSHPEAPRDGKPSRPNRVRWRWRLPRREAESFANERARPVAAYDECGEERTLLAVLWKATLAQGPERLRSPPLGTTHRTCRTHARPRAGRCLADTRHIPFGNRGETFPPLHGDTRTPSPLEERALQCLRGGGGGIRTLGTGDTHTTVFEGNHRC